MNVLHLIDSGGLYGAEQVLLTLVTEQQRQGLAPMILSAGLPGEAEKPLEAEARQLGLPVVAWRMKAGLNIRETQRIIRWAYENGYQILHSHGYKFNILAGLCNRGGNRLKLVTTLHGYVKHGILSRMWVYEVLDRIALHLMDAVVFVDSNMHKLNGLRLLRTNKQWTIPNGIAPLKHNAPALPPYLDTFCRNNRPCLVAIGRLSPEKDFDLLLEAFAQAIQSYNGNCGLAILGDGSGKMHLATKAQALNIDDHVLLAGYTPGAGELLPHFDGLVISSRTEGLPIVLLEAMAASVPIATTAVGAIPEVTDAHSNDPCALVTPPGDCSALASSIQSLLRDGRSMEDMATRATQRFNTHYSSTTMAEKYAACYRSLLYSQPKAQAPS